MCALAGDSVHAVGNALLGARRVRRHILREEHSSLEYREELFKEDVEAGCGIFGSDENDGVPAAVEEEGKGRLDEAHQ